MDTQPDVIFLPDHTEQQTQRVPALKTLSLCVLLFISLFNVSCFHLLLLPLHFPLCCAIDGGCQLTTWTHKSPPCLCYVTVSSEKHKIHTQTCVLFLIRYQLCTHSCKHRNTTWQYLYAPTSLLLFIQSSGSLAFSSIFHWVPANNKSCYLEVAPNLNTDSFMCSGVSNVAAFSGNKVQSLQYAFDVECTLHTLRWNNFWIEQASGGRGGLDLCILSELYIMSQKL